MPVSRSADAISPVLRAIASGRAILVTGAGFSAGAQDATGRHSIPTGGQMAEEIWPIAFGNLDFDGESRLGEIFNRAMRINSGRLRDYLDSAMRVDRSSLPDRYVQWFQLPWYRIYTLNIDDLPAAVQESSTPSRNYEILSAIGTTPGDLRGNGPACIHLHGVVTNFPDVTFSPPEYASRTAEPDPWYEQFGADIFARPTVFVGTQLDEPAMWHYIQSRRGRASGPDPRPLSFLVTTSIPRSREAVLDDELKIDLIAATEQEFFEEEISPNLQLLLNSAPKRVSGTAESVAAEVGTLISIPEKGSPDFLLGAEPTWADIIDGYAIRRSVDADLAKYLVGLDPTGVILHGTAGSGVSTTLRQVAVALNAAGKRVVWLNRDTRASLRDIRDAIRDHQPDYVFMDGTDRFGTSIEGLMLGIVSDSSCICVAGLRTPRVFELISQVDRFVLWPEDDLSRSDAELLVDSLSRAKRLGELRWMASDEERVEEILRRHERQLLVTMIEATSGTRFSEKVSQEVFGLHGEMRSVYSLLCLAGHIDEALTESDVFVALGGDKMANAVATRSLEKVRLIRRSHIDGLAVRHRVVADEAIKALRDSKDLVESTKALLWLAGVNAPEENLPQDRYGRLLIRLLNHDFIYSLLQSATEVRKAYASIESVRAQDFHFWLQRGEFEVAHGDPTFARIFLGQASFLAEEDILVRTAIAHMKVKQACEAPLAGDSPGLAAEGLADLAAMVLSEPRSSPHTYGVYVKFGLEWVRRGTWEPNEKRALLKSVLEALRKGRTIYKRNRQLVELEPEVERVARQLGLL